MWFLGGSFMKLDTESFRLSHLLFYCGNEPSLPHSHQEGLPLFQHENQVKGTARTEYHWSDSS